ncbi:hypothetical protein OG21DRAFT_1503002 [Imleria badia]|nr:hypothetical protein OG21DRAFT_1503002 [Imleria badia]
MFDQQPDDEPNAMDIVHTNHPWGDMLRPVTIFQVLQAESSEDNSLITEGKTSATVAFVAHVTSVKINPAKASYTLEDGTGRICLDKDYTSLRHGLPPEAEEEEISQCKSFEHTYVEIIGSLKRKNPMKWRPMMQVNSINPVHGYHQVMYHILNVIYSNMLSQQAQASQTYDSDRDFGSSEDIMMENMAVDDGETYQSDNDATIQHHVTCAISASQPLLSNTFSPHKHHPYATLKPLERAIMKYMCHHRNHHVLIAELAQAIQESCGCTEMQFSVAVQTLLSEAYITSPLDDGYVVITPRH